MSHHDVTRRRFLQRSAMGAAGISFALGSVVASAQKHATRPASKERLLRWGVIGCGARGMRAHIPAIQSFDRQMQILAVCDVHESRLAEAAKRVGGRCERHQDYQKLLGNRDINAVLIATPNLHHKEMTIAALEAGKHVMCEKPMAV